MSHRELREKTAYLIGAELEGGPAANESVKLPHPKAIGSQGFSETDCLSGLVSLPDRPFPGGQLTEKRPKAGRRTRPMAVFVAEVEVKARPLVTGQSWREFLPLLLGRRGPGRGGPKLSCCVPAFTGGVQVF